jgi:hypothetical protein
MPFHERRAFYLAYRLRDQLAWYTKRSQDHKRTADLWFAVGIVSELAAVIFAVLLVVTPGWPNMIGLLSTVTASSATLARLRGDNEASRRYALAAQELALIQRRIETSTERTFADRVIEAEAAISREHKMWAAKHG